MRVASMLLMLSLLVCFALIGNASAKDAARIFVGQNAPDFTLPAHLGGEITLSNYQGEKNVLLVFYPLAFTPV